MRRLLVLGIFLSVGAAQAAQTGKDLCQKNYSLYKDHLMKNPSDSVLGAECRLQYEASYNPGTPNWGACEVYPDAWDQGYGTARGNHGGWCNVIWIDGHVSSINIGADDRNVTTLLGSWPQGVASTNKWNPLHN